MLTRDELEKFDPPCQYIGGRKIVCEVVKSHLEALDLLAAKEKEDEGLICE